MTEGETRREIARGDHLSVTYQVNGRPLRALADITVAVPERTTVALVGESGCGKSTAARVLAGAITPDSGEVTLFGRPLAALDARARRTLRGRVQLVFQDPYGSLNPHLSVRNIVAEPLTIRDRPARRELDDAVRRVLVEVGIAADAMHQRPDDFSGGQRQRIAIARALVARPDFMIADEIVSALDVSVQAQIINLLSDLQKEHGLSLLVISHDLAMMSIMADFVYVMYLGAIVESGPVATLLTAPRHPYTAALLWSSTAHSPAENADVGAALVRGEPASAADPPSGCPFHPRCAFAQSRCTTEVPVLRPAGDGRSVACFYPDALDEFAASRGTSFVPEAAAAAPSGPA